MNPNVYPENLHTEADARKKWCPFSRIGTDAGTENRYSDGGKPRVPGACRCIADECMAWVVVDVRNGMGGTTRGGRCGLVSQP